MSQQLITDPQPVKGSRVQHGLVVVNTGNGKGKTTAALGVVMRAWGRDMRVIVLQFLKHTGARFGEQRAAQKMGVEMRSLGDGFTWRSKDLNQTGKIAQQQWRACQDVIRSGQYDIVVLDELTYAITFGWVPVQEVIATLRERPPHMHVIITGRDAPQELVDFADLVTEMREVKHPYQKGIKAQPGLEF
ncbi:MAG: cob(I)yrinic acid a,c-diamide adenosyltransferase [Dehalococcoidia bacterium]|nr:cob(I)yrinic acid a,c-diamide adenosyltransferase [Dehalococcoidia bacterium]